MLTVQNVGLILGDRTILDDISFQVSPREKVGLVGVNGAGKSSLLKIVAGQLLPDHGAVSATFSVGYLPQEPRVAYRPDQTALECLLQERGLLALAREIETTARSLGAARPRSPEQTKLLAHYGQGVQPPRRQARPRMAGWPTHLRADRELDARAGRRGRGPGPEPAPGRRNGERGGPGR